MMGSCSTFFCVAFALFSVSHGAPKPGNEAAPANCFDENHDYPGNDFKVKSAKTLFIAKDTALECQALCAATTECNFFTFSTSNKRCYMKTAKAPKVYELGAISGPKACKKPEDAALAVPAVVATVAPVTVAPVTFAPVTEAAPGTNFGSCVTNWCRQNGTSEQFTRCESVKDDGLTCVNPEIKYGSTEGGVPKTTGDTKTSAYDLWCQQLGYAKHSRVTIGGRSCYAPRGAVFWYNGFDEPGGKWADVRNGYWKDGTLSWNHGCFEYGIASLTCSTDSEPAEAAALAVPAVVPTVAPVTEAAPSSNFGSCVTNWCRQNGTSDQFTRCESVKDNGLTCVNPEIKYGSTEGGVPKTPGDTLNPYSKTSVYDLWCQQLGYAKHSRVTIGGRSCYAPRGAVFWYNGFDEPGAKWADQHIGYWKDGTLRSHNGCFKYGIASLTCSK